MISLSIKHLLIELNHFRPCILLLYYVLMPNRPSLLKVETMNSFNIVPRDTWMTKQFMCLYYIIYIYKCMCILYYLYSIYVLCIQR